MRHKAHWQAWLRKFDLEAGMIGNDLLLRFCEVAGGGRSYLRQPWRVGNRTYATNGHYALRLDGADGDESTDPAHKAPTDTIEKLIAEHKPGCDFGQVPELPPPIPCDTCRGTGRVGSEECDDCDGDGTFYHGRHEYDCKECDGRGNQISDGTTHTCPDCCGLGELRSCSRVAIGCAEGDAAYLRVIDKLPGVKVASGQTKENPIAFVFDGGSGILMPMR
jgi:hypothetical protein